MTPKKTKELTSDSDICYELLSNAFQEMTKTLMDMEEKNIPENKMMENCVWPILYELAERFEMISKKSKDVPKNNFLQSKLVF